MTISVQQTVYLKSIFGPKGFFLTLKRWFLCWFLQIMTLDHLLFFYFFTKFLILDYVDQKILNK